MLDIVFFSFSITISGKIWSEQVSPSSPSIQMLYNTTGSKTMSPTDHRMKESAKVHPPFKLYLLYIFPSNKKFIPIIKQLKNLYKKHLKWYKLIQGLSTKELKL